MEPDSGLAPGGVISLAIMEVANKAPQAKSLLQRAAMPALFVGLAGGAATWLLTWGFLTYHGSEVGMSPSVAWPAAAIVAIIATAVGFLYYARR
jgi:hypothetical protein